MKSKTTAMIHAHSPDRELTVTTTFHMWDGHEKIVKALRERGITPRQRKADLGRNTVAGVEYDAGVRERDAVRWLAEVLRDAGFRPVLSVLGQDPRPL